MRASEEQMRIHIPQTETNISIDCGTQLFHTVQILHCFEIGREVVQCSFKHSMGITVQNENTYLKLRANFFLVHGLSYTGSASFNV